MDIQAGIYQHYKGERYLVLGLARHSATDEVFVCYVPLYYKPELSGPRICVRPYKDFFAVVGINQFRFTYLGTGA
jgi:hypothetical protein